MNNLNVLWVEDKPFPAFESRCAKNGISLKRVTNSEDGVKLLNDELQHWDFVLLDGRGTKKGEVENIRGAKEMLKELRRIEIVRKIPYCIFSAYAKDIDVKSIEDWDEEIRVFSKIETKDQRHPYQDLLNYIKEEAAKLDRQQVISLYSDVFEAADSLNIPDVHKDSLVEYLKSLTFEKYRTSCPDGNALRQVIEFINKRLYDVYGLLPRECFKVDNTVNLRDSIEYLCGNKTGNILGIRTEYGVFDSKGPILCEFLGEVMTRALNYTQVDSHDKSEIDDPDMHDINARTNEFRSQVPSTLYLYSAVLAVCDYIKFISRYVSQNSDVATNKARAVVLKDLFEDVKIKNYNGSKREEGTAIVHCDANGTFYCCGHIKLSPKSISRVPVTLSEGCKVVVSGIKPNKDYAKDGYKFFANDYCPAQK